MFGTTKFFLILYTIKLTFRSWNLLTKGPNHLLALWAILYHILGLQIKNKM